MGTRKDLESLIAKRKMHNVPGLVHRGPRSDAEAVIENFLNNGETPLTPAQEKLVARMLFVDGLINGRKHTHGMMVAELMDRFGVTEVRARKDIHDCQKVYGETRKINKQYLMGHHIEKVQLQIQMCMDACTGKDGLLDKDKWADYLPYITKLNDNLTYALNSLPEDKAAWTPPPANIMFAFYGAAPVEKGDLDDAMSAADKLITPIIGPDGNYIEFEDDADGIEPAPDDGADDPGE